MSHRKRIPFLLVAAVAWCASSPCFAVAADAEERWPVGVAEVVITPETSMWMAGYGARDHRSEGSLHDLKVKAIALGKSPLVLITLDLVGIDRATSDEICRRLEAKHGLQRSQIAIATSHTHCGPVAGKTLPGMFTFGDEDRQLVVAYTTKLLDRVEACVAAALADRKPGKLSWGGGTCSFAVNRRANKEAEVPSLLAAGTPLKGPVDHDVPVLAVHGEDGKLRAVVFGYACHATVLSFYQWCGDYPGFAYRELERRHPGAVAFFWAGCGADQNPLPRRTVELAEKYGHQLADSVDAVLQGKMQSVAGTDTAATYKQVPLDFSRLPERPELETAAAKGNKYEQARAKTLLAKLDRDGKLDEQYVHYPVQAWKLGTDGPQWIFLGGEVVVDYALRLKHELGPTKTWVAGYSNDVMAYIPSRRVLAEGGYEGATSMVPYGLPCPWAPMLEEAIVRAVHQTVGKE
jgi:neutral ceramidase